MRKLKFDCLVFLAPPECQGQMIDVSYAGDANGNVVKRVHDRSDRTTEYFIAALDWERENQHEIPGLNRVPFIEGEWEQVILVQQQGA
jgi:hypothetical protein